MNKLSLSLLAVFFASTSLAFAQSFGNQATSTSAQTPLNSGVSYDQCMEQANGNSIQMTSCIVNESDRILKLLEAKYDKMANDEQFKGWNNGAGMFNGNFKELFSSWLQYRDKYCSLYGYSTSPDAEPGTIAQLSGAECILELTKRQYKDMDVITQNMNNF